MCRNSSAENENRCKNMKNKKRMVSRSMRVIAEDDLPDLENCKGINYANYLFLMSEIIYVCMSWFSKDKDVF